MIEVEEVGCNIPNSRLLIVADASARKFVEPRFARHGIGAERLVFKERLPLQPYMALHHDVDIRSTHSLSMAVRR